MVHMHDVSFEKYAFYPFSHIEDILLADIKNVMKKKLYLFHAFATARLVTVWTYFSIIIDNNTHASK